MLQATKIKMGSFALNVGPLSFIVALLIAVAAFLLKRSISYLVDKLAKTEEEIGENIAAQIKSMVTLLIYGIAFLLILGQFGLNLSVILTSFGIIGFAVTFAAKDILSNLFSGAFIFFERTYSIGDVIKVGDTRGIVRVMKLRSTQLETFEGDLVTIPNSKIASSKVVNMTAGSDKMLTSIKVRVSYKADLDEVKRLMEESLEGVEGVYPGEGMKFQIEESKEERLRALSIQMFFQVEAEAAPWIRAEVKKKANEKLVDSGVRFATETPRLRFTGEEG